jgi:hypothetical protein
MSSMIPMHREIAAGTKRLDETRERLVQKIIEERYLNRSRPNVEEICRVVYRRCIEGGLRPVSRNAVRARINRLDAKFVALARHGRKSAQNQYAQRPGHFPVDQILQSVQIDHALADIIVVRRAYPGGVPLTWATKRRGIPIHCATRMKIAAMLPGFSAPPI